MRRRGGFTFIEIIIVIVLVVVLGALVMASFKGTLQSMRAKSAARQITAVLRYARDMAVLREKPVEVRFNVNKDTYELVLLDENGQEVDKRRERRGSGRHRRRDEPVDLGLGEDMAGVRKLPDKIHFAGIYTAAPLNEDTNMPAIIYYADGSATAATVALQSENREAVNVEVFQTTGMARVEKGLPTPEKKKAKLYYGPKKS